MTKRARVQPVIMSGGAGTRLWPMSRKARPKQFLPLIGERSLFQETALRLSSDAEIEFLPPLIIAGAAHLELVESQLAAIEIRPAAIIVEPCPRSTAAVAAVAGAWTERNASEALALLAPADHRMDDPAAFRSAIAQGAVVAAKGAIVSFGVRPTEPHTGYGYIEAGAPIAPLVAEVAAFREKPDRRTAELYVSGGRHFWNAGVFLYSPAAMAIELNAHAPKIRNEATAALDRAARDGAVIRLDIGHFERCPSDSVDYAVMEKTKRAAVVGPIDAGWSDVGSWRTLDSPSDSARIIALDCAGAAIHTDGPLVGAIGLKDFIVVATGDAVLVAPKDRAEEVKKIVEELRARGRDDLV